MTTTTAVRRITRALTRTHSRRFPVPPTALVTGPRLEVVSGDPDQPFYVASIDKVFLATLVAQLFDQRRFEPHTPIGRLLPSEDLEPLPAAPGVVNARDVTVEHLLSHTSGLPDVMLPPRGHRTTCSIDTLLADPSHVWSIPEFLGQARHLPPFARPGERFLYGDTAYFLLIRIIEEARGGRIDQQLRAGVFEPAGMADTARWAGAEGRDLQALLPRLAPIWLTGAKRVPPEFAPNLTWRNGVGGPSTALDLVRFQRELHAGHLCDPRWVRFCGTARHRFRPGIHHGAGMVTLKFGGFFPLLRGYPEPTGGLGYTATHMFHYPREQTHVILNFHAHARMQSSFQMHTRLAGLIHRRG